MNTQILTAILSKDSKDATYKYAPLRAMVQSVSDQSPHKGKAENGWVSYPFGLLIYYWLLYYYPIFASKVFIPQKNGETPELRSGTIKTASYYGLIKESGTYFILPELHELMNEIGTLIIGQDSIISGWAGFTSRAARRAEGVEPVSKEKIMTVLTNAVDVPRDIAQVRNVLRKSGDDTIRCIWTGVRLSDHYHIDHAVPFSLWQNNNLWNLVPVKAAINLSKSDRIPSPGMIEQSSGRIKMVWRLYARNFGRQFEQEIFEGLGTGLDNDMDDAIRALKNKSEYLIEKRGFRKFEI